MKYANYVLKTYFGYIILFGLLTTFGIFNWGRKGHEMTWQIQLPQCFSHSRDQNERLQFIPECNCTRSFFYTAPGKQSKRLNSTCSDEGSFYERDQKIVSLSMCIKEPGDSKQMQEYKEGITENLKRMAKYYPENTMRVYTDFKLEAGSDYCKLVCSNPQLHWCDVRRTPSLGDQSDMDLTTWRFLPLADPTVDYFLSRDLDSVLIERQVAAVNEWLQSSKAFHVMRDKHPEHNAPILAGLWGARNSKLGTKDAEALRDEIIKLAKLPPKTKGRDQDILTDVIFYPRTKNIVAFDSYFCETLGRYTEVRAFPLQRKDTHSDFAGNINLGRGEYNISKCPLECRPKYGKDWDYC